MLFPAETRDDVFWIETRRLWLRWPRATDVDCLAPWIGRPDVAEMTATWPAGIGRDGIAARIAAGRSGNTTGSKLVLVITERHATEIAIGQVGVALEPGGSARLGYHLNPAHWGQGIMTEAVAALADWSFILTRVPQIIAGVRSVNPASRRVLEKCGFHPTGPMLWESPVRGPMQIDGFALSRRHLRVPPSALVRAPAKEPVTDTI
jgi:RimJ/RimL family protein N-acetyltransferase